MQVRGPWVTGAYHATPNDPGKFSADGWLRTGDIGTIDPEGYMQIADRTKDMIKSGGEWISSVELENCAHGASAVAEAAVIAIAHPKWGERPLACIVFKPGQTPRPMSCMNFSPNFAKWQLPDRYEILPSIPRTATGKFWKLKLREQFPK